MPNFLGLNRLNLYQLWQPRELSVYHITPNRTNSSVPFSFRPRGEKSDNSGSLPRPSSRVPSSPSCCPIRGRAPSPPLAARLAGRANPRARVGSAQLLHGGRSSAAPAGGRCDRMSWRRRRQRFVERRRRRGALCCPAAALPPPRPPLGAGDGPDRGATFAAAAAAPPHGPAPGAEKPRQHLLPQQRPPVPRVHAAPRHVLPRLAPLQPVYGTLARPLFPLSTCVFSIRQAVDVRVGLFACRQEGIPEQGQGVCILRARAPDRAASKGRCRGTRLASEDHPLHAPVCRTLQMGAPGGCARVPPLCRRCLSHCWSPPAQAATCGSCQWKLW